MELQPPLKSLSDDDLLHSFDNVLRQDHRIEADIVAHIAEVDLRRLFTRFACPSLFVYCTDVRHFSEAEAYMRIAVARASREHPMLLELLADGRLHLTGVAKLAPHLTVGNRDTLLSRACNKTKRQIEELIAEVFPRPDVPSVIRKLPERPAPPPPDEVELRPDAVPPPSPQLRPDAVPRPVFQPLSPARYKFEFTAGAEFRDKLEQLRALLRAEVPNGDLVAILDKAVTEMVERRKARRYGQTSSPRKVLARKNPYSRHVPAAVRRAVYRRDQGRCCFVDAQGRRCPERHLLEYHHWHPFGYGGGPETGNICLMCPAHNRYLAELDYGKPATHRQWPKTQYGTPGRNAQGHKDAGSP